MLDVTKIRRQNKTGNAMRTTIPGAVLNLLSLGENDNMGWSIEAIPGQPNSRVRVYVEKVSQE